MFNPIERMTITLPRDMAMLVKRAVKDGGYVSSSEVIREALRGWKGQHKAALALQKDIDKGMADLAAGRVSNFDVKRIVRLGRKKLKASRAKSS